ncbi:2-oxo-4-hydroxy-4-carboxy-5-ureidoimidazoline decarboxylase [Actinoplanes sp. NPDC049265]|uniref:2-oxo-4-hydroxy-4-carboxy-5-ureidoimidazoline decarboxylase n=1 Tax=Actinoplanes sp. NPDC049265 TaxID=3363902 RepID=UPI003720661D
MREVTEQDLSACCASPAWVAAIAVGRPYPDRTALETAAAAAFDGLSWDDIAQAMAAHPRIGEPPKGDGREAAWSRREQSGAGRSPELVEANRRYEDRFGHVFLIFASGRTEAEIVAAARERLGNDDATERGIVRDELRKIVMLRLGRLLDALG